MNELEKRFDNTYKKKLINNFLLIKHTDYPTNRKPKQFVDRLLLSKDKSYAFELKQTIHKSIRIDRFKKHQLLFLENFNKKVGPGYLLISLNNFENIFLIHIYEFKKFLKDLEKKSFNKKDIEKILHQKINKTWNKRKSNFILDLDLK